LFIRFVYTGDWWLVKVFRVLGLMLGFMLVLSGLLVRVVVRLRVRLSGLWAAVWRVGVWFFLREERFR